MKNLTRDDFLDLGRRYGWKLESTAAVDSVVSAIRCGLRVAVLQEVGRQDWWLLWGGLPSCCTPVTEIPAEGEADALILITDRLYPLPPELGGSALIYRPPSLALGVATCRGVDSADFAAQVGLALLRAGLSENSLAAVGIAAVRRSDAALIDFTDDRELPLLPYPMEKLGLVHQVIGRRPRRQAGTAAAAALLAAGTQQLLMPPTLAGRAVLAVARRPLA